MMSYPYYYGCNVIDPSYNPYLVVAKSSRLPISIDQVKQQVREDSCDPSDDSLILGIIMAVSAYFENYTNRILLTTTFQTYRDFFPSYILLRKSKFLSIVSFQYYKSGVLTTVDPSSYQITQSNDYSKIIPLCNSQFPLDADCQSQAISIVFKAGYGDKASDIPQDVKMALLQHAAYLWLNRGDCSCDDAGSALPETAKSIYNLNRIKNITGLSI